MLFIDNYKWLVVNISRYMKKRNETLGLPPGSLVHVGRKGTSPVRITVFNYDENQYIEKEYDSLENSFFNEQRKGITWINIDGVFDTKLIEQIGSHFNVHPLVLEDIMNTGQRPKIESFDEYIFLVLKMLYPDHISKDIQGEQISIILAQNTVISFQEKPGDIFENIRDRIRNGKGRIRKMGADYLCYTLLDAIIDHYFTIIESVGEIIEDIEELLIDNPTPDTLQRIHRLKADMIFLRKSIWPNRELINSLLRDEHRLITNSTIIYLKDVYDHTIQVMDTIESFRDIISGMIDIYMSSVSNKMNEVMKVLTIFASIFIPLTFIAGIYGMNFNPSISPFNMPELNWFWGYPFALVLMLITSILMLYYFRRKNWL
jgi:magnesium transporter